MTTDEPLPSVNPLEPNAERDRRIEIRAYHLWEADGRPRDRSAEYWERARELEAMAEHPSAGLLPIERVTRPDEAELEENLGELPGRQTDQGDRRQTPMPRGLADDLA